MADVTTHALELRGKVVHAPIKGRSEELHPAVLQTS
jgi:hypothetical protein